MCSDPGHVHREPMGLTDSHEWLMALELCQIELSELLKYYYHSWMNSNGNDWTLYEDYYRILDEMDFYGDLMFEIRLRTNNNVIF